MFAAAVPLRPGTYHRHVRPPTLPLLPIAFLLLPLLLSATGPVQAKKIYKYTDADGIVHYTDRAPVDVAEVTAIPVRVDQQRIAQLRLEGSGRARRAVVLNSIAGPVEVEVSFAEAVNVGAQPALPLRQVVPAGREMVVASIESANPALRASYRLLMTAVPGDPAAQPEDVEYALPVDAGARWRIDQGFDGSFSHTDPQSRYAIDLNVPEGTPVLAARDGTVMQVEDDFDGAGLDREKFGGRANHVRVLHADGTMAVYAHLSPESVRVSAGRKVSVGQQLGASGNTGFSTGPHLHFAVQVNRGMVLESIPFRLGGSAGAIAIPGG